MNLSDEERLRLMQDNERIMMVVAAKEEQMQLNEKELAEVRGELATVQTSLEAVKQNFEQVSEQMLMSDYVDGNVEDERSFQGELHWCSTFSANVLTCAMLDFYAPPVMLENFIGKALLSNFSMTRRQ